MSLPASARALVIGGTGPTGPAIVNGLEHRGLTVTLFHTGRHEVDEVAHVEHLHGDPFSAEGVAEALSGRTFDVVVACYGRLRAIAEVLSGRCDRFVSVGGTPAYRGYFDPTRFDPP
ncbi:MAG: epimerase, partial [Actinomycetota bacterium]|nr:epimerase [Actinomycetota bacterium]